MFSEDQNCWFIRKVICWRAVASIAWSVLLLPPTTAAFIFLSRFSLFHPVQWITECLSLLTSASTIFSLILLGGVVLLAGVFNLEYYSVVPSVACSRIALIGQVLHPRQFFHSMVHCILGLVVGWCCAVTIGGRYQALGYPCTNDESGPQTCLNEFHLVLLLAGALMGYRHSLLGVVTNMNYVSFNTVQQYKYLCFKGSLPLVFRASALQGLYSLRNFLLLYFFMGHVPRAWVCRTMDLHINSSDPPLNSVSGLLDLGLLYQLWISGTFLLFTWYINVLLFRIFVTEAYSFPVQPTLTEDPQLCLPEVITSKQPLILKYLSLQDLVLLSQHSPPRRLEVFTLSQPGGHPLTWTAVSRECLSLLTDLTERLVTHHDTVSSNGRAKSKSTGSNTTSTTSSESFSTDPMNTPRPGAVIRTPDSVFLRSSVRAGPCPLTAPFTPDLDSPFSSPALRLLARPLGALGPLSPGYSSIQSPHIMRRGPKLWTASTDSQLNGSPPMSPANVPSLSQMQQKPSFLVTFLQNRKDQVKHFLAKRVLVMYLFNKLPEASSQALFADSQAHIWALEGLSNLVAASYSEDQYGVVQTTLPRILTTMLLLQEAVDRHFKLPHASSKPTRSSCSMGDSSYRTLRFALRATLKTAIYRITATFGEHLNAVQLSSDHRKRLQHFLDYKE
ncbi:hypothetical protein UPYG_G00303160 [Umbra pygmaea]|uniref:Nucleoporin NDC1 n=1 Tax=Umbra pygmaea TaxID=75934 RepID=A0ABD0W897_UMBPY